jgi:hypothetical protein
MQFAMPRRFNSIHANAKGILTPVDQQVTVRRQHFSASRFVLLKEHSFVVDEPRLDLLEIQRFKDLEVVPFGVNLKQIKFPDLMLVQQLLQRHTPDFLDGSMLQVELS